jgi:hypothetical protein
MWPVIKKIRTERGCKELGLLKAARENARLGIAPAIIRLCVSDRTLKRYEAKDEAPESIILTMAEEYNCPELPFIIRAHSPIGRDLEPMWLDGIDRSPGTMVLKTEEELTEILDKRMAFNKAHMNKTNAKQFSPQDRDHVDDFMLELIDLFNLVRSYMVWYAKVFGLKAIKGLIRRYNMKCFDHGYNTRENETSALAEALG